MLIDEQEYREMVLELDDIHIYLTNFFILYLLRRVFGQGPFQSTYKFDRVRVSICGLRNKIRVSIDN
jgi:hypothetical protein